MRRLLLIASGLAWIAGDASAQTFPPDSAWTPLPCGAAVMTDPYHDDPPALLERDLVGDVATPAGYRAFDANFLYLRLRLDQDPAPGGVLRPFDWGIEVDLDGNPTNYELLLAVNSGTNQVAVYRNTATTLPNDPADPADQPAAATHPFATHGRSLVAPGSTNGGDNDFFLDFALPWSDLTPLGLTPLTPILIWAGSSATPNLLDGDLACQDRAGGAPTLNGIPTRRIAIDPTVIPDGGVPQGDAGAGPRVFEGGPGCAIDGAGPPALGLFLALALLLALARPRRSPRQ